MINQLPSYLLPIELIARTLKYIKIWKNYIFDKITINKPNFIDGTKIAQIYQNVSWGIKVRLLFYTGISIEGLRYWTIMNNKGKVDSLIF